MELQQIINLPPFEQNAEEKRAILLSYFRTLSQYHYKQCIEYHRWVDHMGIQLEKIIGMEQFPMLPVRLFKEMDLKSVEEEYITRKITSSGTSGQKVSRIYLDAETARNQTKVLCHIIGSFIGKQRLPLIILDTEKVKRDAQMFSARGAGIIGFSTFGKKIFYALDDQMRLKTEELKAFVKEYHSEKILFFGYTSLIWNYVLEQMKVENQALSVREGMLFHIGGWKKMQQKQVDPKQYTQRIQEVFGTISVHNYYGMAEQLGSVYVECEQGHLHCSIYSDVLVRRTRDFSVAPMGEEGMLELFSVLPKSYPGHVLLTEDKGVLLGEDDCPCGRKGKYFRLNGRIQKAEIRGCSDTYE